MLTQPERRSRTKESYPHVGFYIMKSTGKIFRNFLEFLVFFQDFFGIY